MVEGEKMRDMDRTPTQEVVLLREKVNGDGRLRKVERRGAKSL